MPEKIPQQPNIPEGLEKEKKVDLHSLLTYENPKLAEYQSLIKKEFKEKRHQFGQDFSHDWIVTFYDRDNEGEKQFQPGSYEKVLPYLQEKLRAEILIDLGGNGYKGRSIVQLAKKCEAKEYINVDVNYVPEGIVPTGQDYNPYVAKKRLNEVFNLLSPEERKSELEAMNVQADMLNFVARLPDNSVNFTMNGIDIHIIENGAYAKALIEEISRTTRIGGVLFGVATDFWPYDDQRWKSVGEELEFDDGDTYIPRKIFEKVS